MEVWPPLRVDWSKQSETVAKLRLQTTLGDELDEPDARVAEEIQSIPAQDGHELHLRIFRAKRSAPTPGPVIMLWHGGGWVLGSPTMVAECARALVLRFGAVVVAPNYRLAPEHPWPASFNDAWDGFTWVRENAQRVLRADPSRGFIIGGVSAGASMALVFAHLARDEKLEPKVTGVYSACGSMRVFDPERLEDQYRERYLSRTQEECLDNPVLSRNLTQLMDSCAKPDVRSKLYSPLLWPTENGHRGLPRIYQQICTRDGNRDECLIFNDILKNSGVDSRIDLYLGLPHCFWIVLRHLPEFERWQKDTLDGFQWLLKL